jgi:hypothetical protein
MESIIDSCPGDPYAFPNDLTLMDELPSFSHSRFLENEPSLSPSIRSMQSLILIVMKQRELSCISMTESFVTQMNEQSPSRESTASSIYQSVHEEERTHDDMEMPVKERQKTEESEAYHEEKTEIVDLLSDEEEVIFPTLSSVTIQ